MTDSLVLGGQIELLGPDGGIPSTLAECTGATFILAPGYDMGEPQPVVDLLAAGLLDGERPVGRRSSNRTISLPIKITGPDRDTLAAAREVLLALVDEDEWNLVWTRDGGDPMVFDCFRAAPSVPANDLFAEQQLVDYITVNFPALPYGRSDTPEVIQFAAPSQAFPQPVGSVTVDAFGTAANYLAGDASTFEGGTGGWVAAGNCSIARSTAQFHGGAASLALTSSAAGNMQAGSTNPANYATNMIGVTPGQKLNVRGFSRAATAARSVNMGADFYDANGTQVGSTLRGSNVTNSTTVFTTNPTASLTVPAGAVTARANPQVVSTGAGGEVHYFDDISMDTGNAYSYVDPGQWAASSLTPTSGGQSVKWSRVSQDYPVYDHVLPSSIDITGRPKLTFWLGLGTTTSGYRNWHKGTVRFSVTLTDSSGQTLTFGGKHLCHSSALTTQPHWQLITLHITQVASGFDYAHLARYAISVWNHTDSTVTVAGASSPGTHVLQATAYLAALSATPTSTGSPVARGAWYTFPGILGSARAPLTLQFAPGLASFSTVAEFTTPGSNPFTVPAGVTSIDLVEGWGGGGGGAGRSFANPAGGGGGGGATYGSMRDVPVTALGSYPAIVGGGGTGGATTNSGNPGGDSTWSGNSGQGLYVPGGMGGWQSGSWGGGKGGGVAQALGTIPAFAAFGGNGHQSNANGDHFGGGGGSSGGYNSGGNDGNKNDRQGGSAVQGGGAGGDGGKSPGSGSPQAGQPGLAPGGGGGGGSDNGSQAGGNGANGKIRLSYGASGLLPIASLVVHMPPRNAPPAYNPLCPVGGGADPPDGREYTVPPVGALNARFGGANASSYSVYLVASSFSTPASSRTLTVTIRQYPYTGGTAASTVLTRTITPNTDLTGTQLFVDMGVVTLPINALPAGNMSAYFTVGVNSTVAADRFHDSLIMDTHGRLMFLNVAGASIYNNIWIDAPDAFAGLGMVYGSNTDRDQAASAAVSVDRYSGGPLAVEPGIVNRMLVYAQQGCPGTTATYLPCWQMDRAS